MNMHAHDSCGINFFYICEQKRFELATDRVNVKCFVLSIDHWHYFIDMFGEPKVTITFSSAQ